MNHVRPRRLNTQESELPALGIMGFSRTLHNFMRDHAKLTEEQKPLLVSGTLIALRNEGFAKSFDNYKGKDLQKLWFDTIQAEFAAAAIPRAKVTNMVQPYSSLFVHPELGKPTRTYPKSPLHEIVRMLAEKVWPFFGLYREFDIVGQFYGEFLKYTGGDGKGLGIVLTPRHITELFAMIANVTKDSKVLDLCAGTGGFLISAMHQMGQTAVTDADHKAIREKGLVGVEQQPHMFALAASNMILRGDGKANLYQGSCFDEAIAKEVKARQCDVGFLNPPYSQKTTDLQELAFVKQMLDSLAPGGTGVAVVQMSNAISPHPLREELLAAHTLEAVMSLPSDLFYPVGVVTCIMVFTAHKPHSTSDKKTWFGFWKDDGHTKVKHLGRLDRDARWPLIRDRWVTAFRNREVHPGESVQVKVTAADEWCAEAYMDTDYSNLTTSPFVSALKDYVAYRLRIVNGEGVDPVVTAGWKRFAIGELFEIKKGKRLTNAAMTPGDVPFIGAIENNNGVRTYIGQAAIHQGNTITVNYNGSVAEAFYQPSPFWASDDVNVLYPNFEMTALVGIFIAAIIRKEKYRFNYGRKWHLERMVVSTIRLPATENGEPDFPAMEAFMQALPLANAV